MKLKPKNTPIRIGAYVLAATSLLLVFYDLIFDHGSHRSIYMLVFIILSVWLWPRPGFSPYSETGLHKNFLTNFLQKKKVQLSFWIFASLLLAGNALAFYLGSKQRVTHLPHEMTLHRTNGLLQGISTGNNAVKNRNRARHEPYHVVLQVASRNGAVRYFVALHMNRAIDKFHTLTPGTLLELVYRADSPEPPSAPVPIYRIMALWADGTPVWSLDDSVALSTSIKKRNWGVALYCLVVAIFFLLLGVISYRKKEYPTPTPAG